MSYAYTHCLNCWELNHAAKDWGGLLDYERKMALFTWGGPAETLLTSVAGIIGLWVIVRKQEIDAYDKWHLLWITLSYFISRQVFNSLGVFYMYFVKHQWSRGADETKLFAYYGLQPVTAYGIMLVISSAVLAWVTFGIVKRHRKELIVFGFLGSVLGAAFWLLWVGPLLMP